MQPRMSMYFFDLKKSAVEMRRVSQVPVASLAEDHSVLHHASHPVAELFPPPCAFHRVAADVEKFTCRTVKSSTAVRSQRLSFRIVIISFDSADNVSPEPLIFPFSPSPDASIG